MLKINKLVEEALRNRKFRKVIIEWIRSKNNTVRSNSFNSHIDLD